MQYHLYFLISLHFFQSWILKCLPFVKYSLARNKQFIWIWFNSLLTFCLQFLLTSLYVFSVFCLDFLIPASPLCHVVINTVDAALRPVLTVAVDVAPLLLSVLLVLFAQVTWKLLLRWPLTFLWKWNFPVWRLYMLSLIHLCSCTQMTILWKHFRVRFQQL